MSLNDTVFALASGSGRAAIAVVRLSGCKTGPILMSLGASPLPAARRASLRKLTDGDGESLDLALVLWMPAPNSYTGEDAAELHLHAGPAVLDGAMGRLVELGARPAEPGEFTRRAFLNGRLGLTEAEATADLIEAESSAQRKQALGQLSGGLEQLFADWTGQLTHLLAFEEATIDFPEEAGGASNNGEIQALLDAINAQLKDDRRGERVRSGLNIAFVGAPNVGKSSVVNALARREAAIVSEFAGTTRDVIEVAAVFNGVKVTLMDTAGLRDSDDPVEAEGIRRARDRATTADIVVLIREPGGVSGVVAKDWIEVTNKTDVGPMISGTIGVSSVTGEGIEALRTQLGERAHHLSWRAGPAPLTRERHRAACLEAAGHLERALGLDTDLKAEEMRLGLRALGRVTGRVDVDDVLDAVFAQFCIGK